jgi:preprotein translocase subunit YajC
LPRLIGEHGEAVTDWGPEETLRTGPLASDAREDGMDALRLLALGSSQGSGSGGGGGMGFLFLLAALFFIWWFLYLGPQMKRQKKRDALLKALKKGDRVVTRGGLMGVIVGLKEKENIVVVRIAENVKVELLRAAVEGVLGGEEEKK